jgi:16S rRNA (adenine1518-N6/adenine1519-N6)-dimethyltransferase
VTLLGAGRIREIAAELDLRPTKKWGQNFVIDPNTVRRIAELARLTGDDVVLEVGPGVGSLTLALLERAGSVIAVEIDPRLATRLPQTVQEQAPEHAAHLTVIAADAMAVTALPEPPTALVANLPYNVAVPVLLHMLATFPTIRSTVVMVQREVAERLSAEPGSRVYGVPSLKARWYGSVEYAGTIGRTVFWPAPHVDSGLVRITAAPQPDADRARVFSLVDAAFAQRRKTLRTTLSGPLRDRVDDVLAIAGIDPGLRGEQLSLDDFVRIASVDASA